jgi:soluble P-type ATPase
MKKYKVICVDFDGVIHNYKMKNAGHVMGVPFENVRESIAELHKMGYKVVILTAQFDLTHIVQWLRYFGIDYDEITNLKPWADYYIDDKAIKFTNWDNVMSEIRADNE